MIDIVWAYSLVSVIFVSLMSLVGVFGFFIKEKTMNKTLLFLVSFSAGSLLGGAFLHLLPEVVEEKGFGPEIGLAVLAGLTVFFVLEKFIHWRHCHIPTSKNHPHPFAYMNLVGDGLHNFIDGIVIGVTYLVSIPLGISTTLAVVFHEIPQEIGDFGVLLHGGFDKKKALLLNFLTALTAIVGTVVGLIVGNMFEELTIFIIPFTAGGFIYIAGSDLIPELQKTCHVTKSTVQLIGILLGFGMMLLLLFLE
ncbi:ZIP family metal transporter [Candidatus Micrarchaeota archaeon]|jgi:zinc and cadmium transporter|nr:ZIP family metal transporter [Candidatus Micrarchaeota archaeon]